MNPKAIILAGDGINCEKETAFVATQGGFEASIVHVNDLLKHGGSQLSDAKLFVLPGGFSFGDELGSGQILALKMKHGLKDMLDQFLDQQKGAVLGICNGFQVLVRLGIFGSNIVLAQNEAGTFQNKWVGLKIVGNSIFTDPLKSSGKEVLELPIRHGEGKLCFVDEKVADSLSKKGQMVLQYEKNVNGSWHEMAALSAYDGRVLGMMPHPEAFWTEELHPWGNEKGVPLGLELFKNAYTFFTN